MNTDSSALSRYDLIVVGAGSAGVRLARMAASNGHRVAVVEQQYLGGTCVNVGCVPKKLFVYASEFRSTFAVAQGYGWQMPQAPNFDWTTLRTNKDQEIARLNSVYEKMLRQAGVEIIWGAASFVDPYSLQVDEQLLTGKKIALCTGGKPFRPDFPGVELTITSNELFYLDQLPETAVVVGGGYIAVEMAGILQGLGVATTLVYRGELILKGFDRELREFVQEALPQSGIRLLLQSDIHSVSGQAGSLQVKLQDGQCLPAGLVLMATGREPNVEALNLAAAGVATRENGAVVTDDYFRTQQPHIFALGDVTGRVQLTPVALAEAMVLARREFGVPGPQTPLNYDLIATAVFCQPPLASVGLSEDQAREQGIEIDVYAANFRPMKYTLPDLPKRCLIKLIVRREDGRVIGAHMAGDEAGEVIQGIAVAMSAGLTKAQLDQTLGIHPTIAEEFVTLREPRKSI